MSFTLSVFGIELFSLPMSAILSNVPDYMKNDQSEITAIILPYSKYLEWFVLVLSKEYLPFPCKILNKSGLRIQSGR